MNKKNQSILLPVLLFILCFTTPFFTHAAPNWASVDQLIKQQKFTSADKQVDGILKQAKASKDNNNWARALVASANTRIAQGQVENAVTYLQEQAWPEDKKSQVILSLFYAKALSSYIQQYSWEIRQRETIATRSKLPLKKMTLDQLVNEANHAYESALVDKDAWDGVDIGTMDYYFEMGNYPKRIRGTLRDTLTYLWVDFLNNQSIWSVAHSNQAGQLELSSLLAIPTNEKIVLSDNTVHPFKRAAWLLADLERWHLRHNRPEAALEATRAHITRLYPGMMSEERRRTLRKALKSRIEKSINLPWSTMASWSLAQLLQSSEDENSLIQSKLVLDKCVSRHEGSEGGKRCKQALERLLAPEFNLQAMSSDGVQKRSIEVMHKNMEKLYFRAWKVGLPAYQRQRNQNINKLIEHLLSKPKAEASWAVDLPATRDYKSHRTFVTPPMKQLGYWLIVASTDASFRKNKAKMLAVGLNLTNLVAEANITKSELEVTVYQGEKGQLAPNVTAELWQQNYNKPNKRLAVATTSKDGRASFPLKSRNNYYVLFNYGTDSTWLENIYNYQDYNSKVSKNALIFTDRSIYRPNQKVQWKVVAYKGDPNKGNYRTFAHSNGWVKLLDTHGKVVAKKTVKTNSYGSASGEFELKAGHMLGRWNIQTSWDGHKSIRVEEYKRPTFSAEFNDSKHALRLNKPAKVTGTARYYFGQSVTEGKVKWSVTRTPEVSRFYGRYQSAYTKVYRYIQPEIIAQGTTKLDKEGSFSLDFLPKRHSKLQGMVPSYSFNVKADITDSGGETRTATRIFRVGEVAIETHIKASTPFVNAGKPYKLDLYRADLDGTPQQGNGNWTLYKIQQPNEPVLPADSPFEISEAKKPYATEGDKQTPRWKTYNRMSRNKPLFYDWNDGQQISTGTVAHNSEGNAKIEFKALPAGLYRLRYATKDAWGSVFKAQETLIVSGDSGANNSIQLPTLLKVKSSQVEVGENIELLIGSGFKELPVVLDVYQGDKRIQHSIMRGGIRSMMFPVKKENQGGLTFVLSAVKDYQVLKQTQRVSVLRKDRTLDVSFSTFRDKLSPGQKETWRVTVKDSKGKLLEKGAAEVLASMYDKSLDFFGQHDVFDVGSLYPEKYITLKAFSTQRASHPVWQQTPSKENHPTFIGFEKTRLKSYQVNYRNMRSSGGVFNMFSEEAAPAPVAKMAAPVADMEMSSGDSHTHPPVPGHMGAITHSHAAANPSHQHKYSFKGKRKSSVNVNALSGARLEAGGDGDSQLPVKVRTNFNETAFFYPHLILEQDGSVSFEFEVPESLTEWNVWVSALTSDLRGGSTNKQIRTSKDLMIRPYLPRFLREGDRAEIEVVVNNMADKPLSGQLELEIFDPETEQSLAANFKLDKFTRPFNVQAGASTHLRFALTTPNKPGVIAIRAKARAGDLSDGEQRPLPILPSRIHLMQSRFAALNDNQPKTLSFEQLASHQDSTRINEKLVVNVEGQLFYSALNALPYLTEYPYECTEQTLNRYLSTAIVKSVFDKHPAVATMAKKLSKRDTQYENWGQKDDPNRKMLLEETPWLVSSEGGSKDIEKLFRILDPKVASVQRQQALEKLRESQTSSGGFPWWSGGPPSPYMTMYQLDGFSRALEFKSEVPKDMVQRAWRYLHNHYKNELSHSNNKNKSYGIHEVTYINYLLSAYPDTSWTGGVFTNKDRQNMLKYSFKHWQNLSGLLKSYLALTLHRAGRHQDARLVFDSIMDNAKTDPQLGTYWAPEDRSWLWYNDTIETHAFILRALMELNPKDSRRHGIVQWLMLDKKLNHWKSTRATAESIYALVHYLKQEGQLGVEERANLMIGSSLSQELVFKPDEYTGHKNQVVVEGKEIKPDMAKVTVKKEGKGVMFASATWHYSTEKLPEKAEGDFFHVTRKFYKRIQKNKQWTLQPLAEGAVINVGDQLEVQLSLRTKHNAEYVHLRSPRGAGFEPVSHTSGYKWDLGIGYYEEIRDSGANYFFERLPTGEYSFKYRLRATTAGQFRTAPAMVQSMYAPEFTAYSSGKRLEIRPNK